MAGRRKQHVFLIHGIGKHDAGWELAWKNAFLEHLASYSPFRSMEAKEREAAVDLVPLSYDSIFEGFRTSWSDLAGAIAAVRGAGELPLLDVLEHLEHLDSSDPQSDFEKLFWENLLDVALWFGSKIARSVAIKEVVRQLTNELGARIAPDGSNADAFHVIAHSLGTSVIHDSLVALALSAPTRDAYGPSIFRFQTLTTIANVSSVMQSPFDLDSNLGPDAFKVYRSVVRPSHLLRDASVCRELLNVRHELDPVTWPSMFEPLGWREPNYLSITESRFVALQQVHDVEHYLAAPNVHVRLFRRIFGAEVGTQEEVTEAIKRWKNRTSDLIGGVAGAIGGVGGVAAGDGGGDPLSAFRIDRARPWALGELISYLRSVATKIRIRRA